MTVSAVIVGEYSGWNPGLAQGGFGALLIATFIAALMYGCLVLTIAEMSAAMPFTGGAYGFARAAFGPWGGMLAGTSQVMEYVLVLSVIMVLMGVEVSAAVTAAGWTAPPEPLIWLVITIVFIFLNAYDTRLFFRSATVLCLASIAVLAAYWIGAVPFFDPAQLLTVPVSPGGSAWLPKGTPGIAYALPFAIWFFISIEMAPLAAEELHNPVRSTVRGLTASFLTLLVAALVTLFLTAGTPPGALKISDDNDPLLDGFFRIFNNGQPGLWFYVLVMIGSVASFHSTMFASGRGVFSLARAGYLPAVLARTGARRTPFVAIAASSAAAFLIAVSTRFVPQSQSLADIFLHMSVLAALVNYVFQFTAHLRLAVTAPDMDRPFTSPIGATGAVTGLILSATAAILMFTHEAYVPCLIACGAIYAVCAALFAAFGRARVIPDAPEEAFANRLAMTITRGQTSMEPAE